MNSSATKFSLNQSLVTNPIGASNLAPTTTTSPKNAAQDYLIKRIALTIFAYVKAIFQLALAIGLYPIHFFKSTRHTEITDHPRATQPQGSNSTVTAQQTTPPETPLIQKATVLKNDAPQQSYSLIPQELPSSTPQLTPAQATTVKNAIIENTEGPSPKPLSGKIVNPFNITIVSTALAIFLYSISKTSNEVLSLFQETAQDSPHAVYVHEELSLLDNTTTCPLVGQPASLSDSKVNDWYLNPYYANSTSGLQSFYTTLNNISNSQNMSLFGGAILVASIVVWTIYKLWGTKIIKEADHSPKSGSGVGEGEDNIAQPTPDTKVAPENIHQQVKDAPLENAKEQPTSQDQSPTKETLEEQHSAISQIEGEKPIINLSAPTGPSNSPSIPEKPSVNTHQSIPQNQDQNSSSIQIEETEIVSYPDRKVSFLLPVQKNIPPPPTQIEETEIISYQDRKVSFLLPVQKNIPYNQDLNANDPSPISEEQAIPDQGQNSPSIHAPQEDELEQLLRDLQNN